MSEPPAHKHPFHPPVTAEGFSGQEYFPEKLGRQEFYQPVDRGFEREVKKRLDYFARLREQKSGDGEE